MAAGVEQPFACQCCHARLNITDVEALHEPAGRRSALLGASVFGGRLDESFVVLDSRRGQQGGAARSLDESFVVLPGSASALRQAGAGSGQLRASAHGIPLQALDDCFAQLARTFELAFGETKVDQPLCMECAGRVREETEAACAEAEAECAAYEAALGRLAAEDTRPLPPEEFEAQRAVALAEAVAAEAEALAAEAALATALAEADAVRTEAAELAALEARYWHGFNDLQLHMRAHAEERGVLLRRIDRTAATLERLRRTNVYNDAFHIWHDGQFGTISGFRMGRTSQEPIEWDEINAAWGQAVFLLHTLAQACKLSFSSHRLLPMGSYPRIADRKGVYELFGPVNKLYCAGYDRAMIAFLACLREFAEYARGADLADPTPGVAPLELPYAVEGDRVGGLTVKLMFNKDARWSRALKYLLTDLKWCLSWAVARLDGQRPAPGGGGAPGALPADDA